MPPPPTYRPTCPGSAGLPSDPAMKISSPGCIAETPGTGAPTSTCWNVVRGRATPAAPQARIVSPEQSHPPGPVPPHRYGWPSWARANRTTVRCWASEGRANPVGSVADPPPPLPGPAPPWPGQLEAAAASEDASAADGEGGVGPAAPAGQYAATSGVAVACHRATAVGNALCWTWSEATVMGSSCQLGTTFRARRNRIVAATGSSRTLAGPQLAPCWNRPRESRAPYCRFRT